MSVKIVENQIRKFLSSDRPEVLSICGAWGIGKTFLWNRVIEEVKDEIKLEKYSYVSLFGIDSLKEFKLAVFTQMINRRQIGQVPNFATFKDSVKAMWSSVVKIDSKSESGGFKGQAKSFYENLRKLGWKTAYGLFKDSIKALWVSRRKGSNVIKDMPFIKSFSSAIDSISFLSIDRALICIDDFERRGKDLEIKDVLGLVSLLKEQKNCKVVLIFNDEILQKNDSEGVYQQFREKVIDVGLMLNPTAEEVIGIVGWNKKDDVYKKLEEFAVKLGVRNIRILNKIEYLAGGFKVSLAAYSPEILHRALHSLVLLCWCFYTDKKKFDFLRDMGEVSGFADDRDDEEAKKWKLQLQNYGYLTTDDFDFAVADAVEVGYINEEQLINEAEKLAEQYRASGSYNSFADAWKPYRESFDDNQEEVVNGINDSFRKNYKYLSPLNLDEAVNLFRKLDRVELADELIEFYIENMKEEVGLFNLVTNPFYAQMRDERLKVRFNEIYRSLRQEKTIREILQYIAEHQGWKGEDKKVLEAAGEQEYYDLFKAEHGEQLGSLVSACLLFSVEQARNALVRIGKENKLNRMRIASLGIKIDEESK